jgi:probable HAF family extracellular repeat protein
MKTLLKAFLQLTLLSLFTSTALLAHDLRGYRIADIGTFGPPERPVIFVSQINNRGHVTGDPRYIYRNGELEMLDLPGVAGVGIGINERDQIAGHNFESFSGPQQVFLWDEGAVQFIGTPGQTFLGTNPLNERGELVGGHAFEGADLHAFLYRRGTLIDLGTLGGDESFAVAINNRSMVIGSSEIAVPSIFDRHPFLWVRGEMIDLHPILGNSAAIDINDLGDIAGTRSHELPNGGLQSRPFLLTRGRVIDVPLRADHSLGFTVALNIRREIVGSASTVDGRQQGFHFHRGKFSLLTELWHESDPLRAFVTLRQPADINDRGQILLGGTDSRSIGVRGYILTPRSLPHQLVSEMLLLARFAHLPQRSVVHLHRARASLAVSNDSAALASLERFIERVRANPPRKAIPKWVTGELLRDAEDVAEILRGWQRSPF